MGASPQSYALRAKAQGKRAAPCLYRLRATLPHTLSVNLQILAAIGMPLLMAFGGIAAWRLSKNEGANPETPAWRDDSLDDWRKERDAVAEERRASRPAELREMRTGQEEQQETTKKHQRIGG